ncbi:ArsR family transcriptional regulator [Paenibacillus psychroresistens]|uniref:ArsR family transcriptional regulator n=1 Tax=Paenibacillus psychroresistens TaxID=1778678 RepID=A0A6B8RSD0_9BACL|nr:metalloregulator ArsR/SmtB family transcription factor [Paenibacillus psychroresistens]QGQ99341.1 ArsR family transcriptional regulator [Paenibacillus psychroresistens]
MNPEILRALAEPTRLRIVELLRNGPITVGEIASKLQIRQPQASKHLKVLNEAQIVDVDSVANRRFYKLRSQSLQEMDYWLSTFRSLWKNQYDELDEYLTQFQNQRSREE